ncbi:hypothetical protein DSO57_1023859 [Entomophthora muscae]|uniref:Uncharacterized protein n=1 Tax=Entomophthora muscae TaxID=34485 RepID=A0ACC2RTV2_9FUNG|nr:hypothetical protein DSO57_1023859 [Entomophthora muscae]
MVMVERVQQGSSKKTDDPKEDLDKQKTLTFHKNVFNRTYYENLTFTWQEKLFAEDSVQREVLSQASLYLCPKDYADVVAERNVISRCGYPLCPEAPKAFKSDTHLSVRDRKLYDLTPLKPFCSNICFGASRFYEVQLSSEPVYLRNFNKFILVDVIPLGIPVVEYVKNRKPLTELLQEEKKNTQKSYIDKKIKSANKEVDGSLSSLLQDVKLDEQPQNKDTSEAESALNHTAIEGYSAPLVPSSIKSRNDDLVAASVQSAINVPVEESDLDSLDEDDEDEASQSESTLRTKAKGNAVKLTVFCKLFLFLDHSATVSSKEFFEHFRRSQDPSVPRKRFINKVIPRDDNVVLRQDMLSKLLLERWHIPLNTN